MTLESEIKSPSEIYLSGISAGHVTYQHCDRCAHSIFYPRTICPNCGATELSWLVSAGRGVVYASTVIRKRDAPYSVALIDLDEGFRMMARLAPVTQMLIGARVRAEVDKASMQVTFVEDVVEA